MWHYNVRPRYTPGSPAMVSADTALQVAHEEKQAYEHHLVGAFGSQLMLRAKALGLKGIVERVQEVKNGKEWQVGDLITHEEYERPVLSFQRRRPNFAFGAEKFPEGGYLIVRVEKDTRSQATGRHKKIVLPEEGYFETKGAAVLIAESLNRRSGVQPEDASQMLRTVLGEDYAA